MKASEARTIFNKINKPLTLKRQIKQDICKGFSGTTVSKMNDDDPKLKKLRKKGYLITHTDNYTYITWAY